MRRIAKTRAPLELNLPFDRLDLEIMEMVRGEPSATLRSIARSVGVAQSTVGLRLKALARSGALRTIAVVNARQAGYQIFAVFGIQARPGRADSAAREIAKIPEVIALVRISGPFDLSAWLIARDRRHLWQLVADRIGKIRDVEHVEGDLALDVVKYEIHLRPRSNTPVSRLTLDNVDELEAAIVEALHESAQTPIRAIAQSAKVADATIRSRVLRLQEAGILSIRAVSDPLAIGRHHVSFVGIRVNPGKLATAAEKIARLPEVAFLTFLLGRNGLLAITAVDSHEAFAAFLESKLSRIDGVERTEAGQIHAVVKFDDRWVL